MGNKIILQDAFKRFTFDQDKIMTPEETVRRFHERLAAVDLDILKETRRIDNGRLDIPIFFSHCGRDALALTGTQKQMGKGGTPAQAEASAVMELAERFSLYAFMNAPDNFVTSTAARLGDRSLAFDLVARSVHDTSEELAITRQFYEDLPLQWTPAYNLTRRQEVMVPYTWFFTINQFNGSSAGNCVEEALSQGICEVVERHVSSIISHRRLPCPAIRPSSADDPLVRELLAKYDRAGIELQVTDFTLDMGIPSVGILAYDPSTFPKSSEIVWTAGTTPDPQKAFSRALTEVAQLAGDFNSNANYVASGLPKFTRLAEADFVLKAEEAVDIQSLPDVSSDNIKTEVENCVAALAARDMDVIVVETTHPGLDIPAFYTIVPGAHFRERSLGTSVGMFTAKLMAENLPPAAAIGRLESMDRHLPDKYFVKFFLGNCHLAQNDYPKARGCLQAALDLDPHPQDAPSIYSYLGVCLKEMGRYQQALEMLQRGERLDCERTDIYNLMGFCHFKLGHHQVAIDNFKKVLALNPSSAIDYANIAVNYRAMGDAPKAIHYFQLALGLDAGIEFARDGLAGLLTKE